MRAMLILLFRHGIAEDAPPGGQDRARALTSRGVERTVRAARGLARIADRPEVILTSPKIRAVQTAAIAGEVFDRGPEPVDTLAEGPAKAVLGVLRQRTEQVVMVVGHEPWMSELIELLLTRRTGRNMVALKKAGAALVDAPLGPGEINGPATLHWLLPPRVLRSLVP